MARQVSAPLPAMAARPLRADARRNRERILEAGRKAFADSGRDVQMDEIALRAGVGVGTLYRHFPTKEDLVLELIRESVREFVESTRQALTHDDAWEGLEWLVRSKADSMARNHGLRDAMSGVQFADENPWHTPDARSGSEAVLARAREQGAIRADITVDDFQALMCGLSAAVASGADAGRHADFVLAALRATA